ncbi:8-amino-7-oxononanoate synthase [Candidatus Desantisbacteria bacterium]|nr:8-amino-7-oxononanoate synthase [Candidatus Desantisbacteria bacterium]
MDDNITKKINEYLENLKKNEIYRSLKEISGPNSSRIIVNKKEVLNFCSNNYLGLSTHPEVIAYTIKILNEYGTGAGSSRLIAGNLSPVVMLEEALAKFSGAESALVFPSGYQANIGIITSLAGKNDAIFCDHLCHASIIDGALLSRAKLFRYPHKNSKALKDMLSRYKTKFRRKLIITESIFSMDGDIAPLSEIAELASKFNTFLLIDEAHAFGILGKEGRGALEIFGLKPEKAVMVMGTMGKTLGSSGAFVACTKELKEYFINKARSFIFTTGIAPAICGTALKSLEIICKFPGQGENLIHKAKIFRDELKKSGFNCMESESQIIPVLTGDNTKTMLFSKKLLDSGIYIQGIRPPTVPPKSARLRISVMSTHTEENISECLKKTSDIGKTLGII